LTDQVMLLRWLSLKRNRRLIRLALIYCHGVVSCS